LEGALHGGGEVVGEVAGRFGVVDRRGLVAKVADPSYKVVGDELLIDASGQVFHAGSLAYASHRSRLNRRNPRLFGLKRAGDLPTKLRDLRGDESVQSLKSWYLGRRGVVAALLTMLMFGISSSVKLAGAAGNPAVRVLGRLVLASVVTLGLVEAWEAANLQPRKPVPMPRRGLASVVA
jgi:hypothetical protein